jgi:V/A-type H+-transporting ATPase subunit A
LQQNAYDPVDTYCDLEKQLALLQTIRQYSDLAAGAQKVGVMTQQIIGLKAKNDLPQIKFIKDYKAELEQVRANMEAEFAKLREAS